MSERGVIRAYCTTYCNRAHRMSDGKPIGHECYVLPPRALRLEYLGNVPAAIEILARMPRRVHRGVRQ